MQLTRKTIVACLFLFVGVLASAGDERRLELDQVPQPVRQAALRAVPGVQLTGAEVEQTSRGTLYELEGTVDGVRCEIEVTADGKVVEIERGNEEEVPLSQVPVAVLESVAKELHGAKPVEAERLHDEHGELYEIEVIRDGRVFEVKVRPDGTVVRVDEESEDQDEDSDDDEVRSTRAR